MVETLTLLGVVAYAIIANKQWHEMISARHQTDTSIQITKDSLFMLQRAFVHVSNFEPVLLRSPKTQQPNGGMKLVLIWENAGATPTREMVARVNEHWFAKPIGQDFPFPDYPKDASVKMFVAPKAASRASAVLIPQGDIAAIKNHSGHLYIWGWARYHDVFEKTPEHITRFCSEVIDSTVNPNVSVSFETPACETGNCRDDECKEK